MILMKHIITTCGNSILGGNRPEIDQIDEVITQRILSMKESEDFLKKVSAETNGLTSLQVDSGDQVSLIVTDTLDGFKCAECLVKLIESTFNCGVDLIQVEGLQVGDASLFRRKGVSNLFSALDDLRKSHQGKEILHCSGGFKAVVPYIVLYGLLNQIEVAYIFERSENLIKLPPAPLGVDYTRASMFVPILRWVDGEGCVSGSTFQQKAAKVPFHEQEWFSSLFYEDEGLVHLSAFGEIVLSKFSDSVLKVQLSKDAIATLEAASSSEKTRYINMLSKMQDPGQRSKHIHRWESSDLRIHKPGSVAERAVYFEDDGCVKICALFLKHDQYERKLKGKKAADFKTLQFEEYSVLCSDDSSDPLSEHESALKKLEEEKKELSRSLTECRKKLDKRTCEVKEHEKNIARRRKKGKTKPKKGGKKSQGTGKVQTLLKD